MKLKQYIYQCCDEYRLTRIPLARWQRVLALTEAVPAYQDSTIKIIYAYVELDIQRPVYCHRIEAVRYTFDMDGFYSPAPLPDLDLLTGIEESKVTYLSVKQNNKQYFAQHYWEVTPLLLDLILEKIWSEKR